MMKLEDKTIHRVALHLTWRCSLRCEKCGAYIPQSYEQGKVFDYDWSIIRSSMEKLFSLVDGVEVITLTGGEAILHPSIFDVCRFLLENEKHFNRIDFQTNGSIPFKRELLAVMCESKKFTFFIDHYGPDISTRVDENVQLCEEYGVNYNVRTYYGKEAHMNGWIDWSPRKEPITVDEAKEQFAKCANGRWDRRPFVIYGNVLTLCAMPFCRARLGMQPESDMLALDLLDEALDDEKKREKIFSMRDTHYNPGCRYCPGIGVDPNAKRYPAGKQVERA